MISIYQWHLRPTTNVYVSFNAYPTKEITDWKVEHQGECMVVPIMDDSKMGMGYYFSFHDAELASLFKLKFGEKLNA